MRTKFIFVALSLFWTLASTQSNNTKIPPCPKIGWDSLQTKFVYPELASRAMLWGAYQVKLTIDSVGRMTQMDVSNANYEFTPNAVDSVFINYIKYYFRFLEWDPGILNQKPTTMQITVPLVFYFSEKRDASRTIFIKGKPSYPTITNSQ